MSRFISNFVFRKRAAFCSQHTAAATFRHHPKIFTTAETKKTPPNKKKEAVWKTTPFGILIKILIQTGHTTPSGATKVVNNFGLPKPLTTFLTPGDHFLTI